MKPLSKLFSIKPPKPLVEEPPMEVVPPGNELDHGQRGYADSKQALGSPLILKDCLENNYQKFVAFCRESDELQRRLMEPYIQRKAQLQSDMDHRKLLLELKEGRLGELKLDVDRIDTSIIDVRSRPEKYGLEVSRKPKVQFYIGLAILLPVTLYLMVFYISASYSAFFKDFDDITNVIAAIFDAQALSKAWKDGWLETVFVSTIPFVFMGMGYLIHMIQAAKSYLWQLKLAMLFVVTFLFDVILAYGIEKKIYEFEKTLDSRPFDLFIAFQKVDFWGIIFAGFVVYVIWGMVMDFILKEYEDLDKVKAFIRDRKKEKLVVLDRLEQAKVEVGEVKQEVTVISGKLNAVQQTIDGVIIPNRKYLEHHAAYVQGWLMAILQELRLPAEQYDALLKKCQSVCDTHKELHGVRDEHTEVVALD
jgi:hypothetical protein